MFVIAVEEDGTRKENVHADGKTETPQKEKEKKNPPTAE
jgi:hypothetical protein